MRNIHLCVLAATVPVVLLGSRRALGVEEPAAKPRFGPLDVELTLRDRSRIRVRLVDEGSVSLRTAYGLLEIPTAELRRIQRGDRLSTREQKVLAQALTELNSDDFAVRQAAQDRIAELGVAAAKALKDALPNASAEVRLRVKKILKRIEARRGPPPQPLDTVKTRLFEARGTLEVETFTVSARFGTFDIRFDDISRMQWLAHGELCNKALDVNEASVEWVDTGVDVEAGEPVLTRCSGLININGGQIDPGGSRNWGRNGQFLAGSLIGRVGLYGKEFLIAKGKRFTPDDTGRLYVKIHVFQSMLSGDRLSNASGQYDFLAATGTRIEELERMPQVPGQ